MRKRQLSGGSGGGKAKVAFGAGGVRKFINLSDAPHSYASQGGKLVIVKGDETGLEFTTEFAVDRHDVKIRSEDDDPQFLLDKIGAMAQTASLVEKDSGDEIVRVGINVDDVSITQTVNELVLRTTDRPVKEMFDPTSALPVSPAKGDRFIATADGYGWTKDHIYESDDEGTAYFEFTPYDGMVILLLHNGLLYSYVNRFTYVGWYEYPYVDDVTIERINQGLSIKSDSITDTLVYSDNKDGDADTPCMRTLGTGALQAAPGNIIVTVDNATDEAAAFAAGAIIVIRSDLV